MKILIAYDGSECSEAAIVDLGRAGLPARADVEILTIAEEAFPVSEAPYMAIAGGASFLGTQYLDPPPLEEALHNAGRLVEEAAIRLRVNFPNWKINTETWADSPQSAILRKAHGWKPDLIVVGSHGRSRLGRMFLGSVSQHVLHHASCSVRISRHHLHPQERPIRLVIGTDGSDGAHAAVRAVAQRNWPAGTEVRVVGVVDTRMVVAASSIPEGVTAAAGEEESLRSVLSKATRQAVAELSAAGLRATPQVLAGVPAAVLVADADAWGADCIFVGARGLSALERVLLGNASAAIAAKARCSVEVVRRSAF